MILADKDMTNGWGGAADGTREKRVYLLQNWRADVSCVTDQNGKVLEWVKYSPYGVPFRIDPADFDRDGDVDSSDSSAFTTEYNNGGPRADTNHDGFIDFTDYDLYMDNSAAASAGGRNVLSRGGSTSAGIHNRIGYAGYLWDSATSQYHVRNRVFLPSLGRWSRRDPIGYVDGMSLFDYVKSNPIRHRDPKGLCIGESCDDIKPIGGSGDAGTMKAKWTSSDECTEQIHNGCFDDPVYGPLIREVYTQIDQKCRRRPTLRCSSCADQPPGVQGYAYPGTIVICKGAANRCKTLLHELIHIRQFCEDQKWPNTPSGCMKGEYEAYASDPASACNTLSPCDRVTCLCRREYGSCGLNYPGEDAKSMIRQCQLDHRDQLEELGYDCFWGEEDLY